MSLHLVSIIHIDIHNFQANTALSSGHGGRVIQRNDIHHQVPVTETYLNPPESTPRLPSATERRIEAQPRIRRKLKEVSTQSGDTLSRIGLVASLATEILSAIEQTDISFDLQLVDLAMDAHAVAYIAVILCLYWRPRMSKKSLQRLTELLDMIHTLVVAVPTRNVIALLKKFATRRQRKVKAMRMREDLLNLLRKMERNQNADLLSSLNAALAYHHQHSDVDAAV